MKKILIIGISGTGKSRLGRKLSEVLNIPLTHYDTLVWGENWNEINENIVEQELDEIVKNESWILEGYIQPAAKVRLEAADIVLYLDYSGFQALLGGLKRWWQHRGQTRPEMADGCIETLEWKRLNVMWNRLEREEIELAICGFEQKIVRLRTRKETEAFIQMNPLYSHLP